MLKLKYGWLNEDEFFVDMTKVSDEDYKDVVLDLMVDALEMEHISVNDHRFTFYPKSETEMYKINTLNVELYEFQSDICSLD